MTAETEYASTPEGHAEAVRKAVSGESGPGGLPSERWVRIADDGDALRERNAAIAREYAKKVGDAFHAAAQECAGDTVPLPKDVRGLRSLGMFLDQEVENMFTNTHGVRDAKSDIASLDSLLAHVGAAVPDPDATFASRVPRSEEEKGAWLNQLNELRAGAGRRYADQFSAARDSTAVLERFGRPTDRFISAMTEPRSPQDVGFVGRIRAEDGSLSEDAYVVVERTRDNTVAVIPVRPMAPTPSTFNGRMDTAGERIELGAKRRRVVPASMERADDATWNRFVGTARDQYFSYGGGHHDDQVYMRTSGQSWERSFDDFRYHRRVEVDGHTVPVEQWTPVSLGMEPIYGPNPEPKIRRGLRGLLGR